MRLALGLRTYNYKYYCIQGSKLIITYDTNGLNAGLSQMLLYIN
ncbi:hypothetical protein ACU8KH_06089 [Lachancea thermotolerans]